jgi:hypothetical protein
MKEFTDDLNRVLKYSRTNWEAFQHLLTEQPRHRWGGPNADKTLRGAAADAYEEDTGDSKGAGYLRNPDQHVVIRDGRVKKGQFNLSEMRDWLNGLQRNIEDWANAPEAHGVHLEFAQQSDGTVRVEQYHSRPLIRSAGGNGRYDTDPEPDNETFVSLPSEVGGYMADVHQRALERDLGWNTTHTHSTWGEPAWNDFRGSVEMALDGLRHASFEEPVPEERP